MMLVSIEALGKRFGCAPTEAAVRSKLGLAQLADESFDAFEAKCESRAIDRFAARFLPEMGARERITASYRMVEQPVELPTGAAIPRPMIGV